MEQDFEHAVVSSQQMNGMMATYEATLIESYGEGRQDNKKKNRLSLTRKDEQDHYMIFDAV